MDETALSTSILQFVDGQGLAVRAPEIGCIASVPNNGVVDAPTGDLILQTSSGEGIKGCAGASGGTAGAGSTAVASSEQQQGLMRRLMGNKLGNFNMRGVEAGMAMCDVTKKKPGKLLNTRNRRQRRKEQGDPYGNSWSSRGKRNSTAGNIGFKGGEEGPSIAGDASPPSSKSLRDGESLATSNPFD